MLKINVSVKGLDAVRAALKSDSTRIRKAVVSALNKTAYGVRKDTIGELESKLDRPKPYTTKQAVQVIEATESNMTATIGLGVKFDAPSKGTSYEKALGHHFVGGRRRFKKFEAAFERIGLLPPGWMIVPGGACPLDAYGNIPARFIVQMIAYFNAFGEQGYKANMSDRSRSRMAKRGVSEGGYRTINGAVYFVSRGKGNFFGAGSWREGRIQHLAPGVWKKSGTHGSNVQPVLMFVRPGTWQKRVDLNRIAVDAVDKRFEARLSEALSKR